MKEKYFRLVSKSLQCLLMVALVFATSLIGYGNTQDAIAAGLFAKKTDNSLTTRELRDQMNAGMTGNYVEDTKLLVTSLRTAVTLPPDSKEKAAVQSDARYKINAYSSRYRADAEKNGLYSFTTLRTALNAVASYYNGSSRRSVPQKVRDRVMLELDRVDTALSEGR
jgi:photosystem II Psb27 protein